MCVRGRGGGGYVCVWVCVSVDFNGSNSKPKYILLGVPQGSMLGHLLFFVYINDPTKVSHIFKILMYADDTTLYCNLNATNCKISLDNKLSEN